MKQWYEALEDVRKYTFKITTPQGHGTGFLVTYREKTQVFGIATAYHVIEHAYLWEEPIKLMHTASEKEVIIRHADRFIFANAASDTAVVLIQKRDDFPLETTPLVLAPEDKYLKPGAEVGWAGYPNVAPGQLSFFSGCVSCYLKREKAYLIDGVAINGVSGGPAFTIIGDKTTLIGVVSAYIPNRASGESLPGVCFVVGIDPFYKVIKDLKSLEEAKETIEQAAVAPTPPAKSSAQGG